jgi:hypothetical protein
VEQRLDALGYEHRFRTYAAAEHLTFALLDHWGEAARWMRVHRRAVPRRVTYKYAVGWDAPAVSPQLTGDHAYWVSGITPRQPGTDDATRLTSYASVDAEMTSRPGALPPVPARSAGVDDMVPYADIERAAVPGSAPLGRDLQISAANTSALAVDVAAGGLADGRPFCLRLSTDGPVVLALTGAASFHAVLDPTCSAGAPMVGASSVTATAPGTVAVALAASS